MDLQETHRLQQMSSIETELYQSGFFNIAGIDEAGRGPLAGPVVAASCILPKGFAIEGINDSKLMKEEDRLATFLALKKDPNVHFAIAAVDADAIDEINILQASLLAMKQSVDALKVVPDYLLIDGNRCFDHLIEKRAVVKGDQRSISIAAASVLAKCYRDQLMLEYHEKWPEYGFNRHKGYGTAQHKKALQEYGPCPIHRKSFAPVSLAFSHSI